MSVPKKVT
ncbi:UNVERIFIED_CONTAM: hypothetical protein GTU68_000390 [Idotea baltica]|nr:hypothetical protein [Idotea baltica]